jgi:hypothetical protein
MTTSPPSVISRCLTAARAGDIDACAGLGIVPLEAADS